MADTAAGRLVTVPFLLVNLASFAYFISFTIMYPVLPVFVEDELSGSGLAVGLSVGAFGLSAAVVRPIAGRIGDTHGRRVLVVGGTLLAAISFAGYLAVTAVWMAVGLRLVFGVAEAFAFVGFATAIQDMAPPDRRGEAASYASAAVYGALVVGPVLGEALFDGSNYDVVWWAAIITAATGTVLGLATPPGVVAGDGDHGARNTSFVHPAAIAPGLVLAASLVGYAVFVSFIKLLAGDVGLSSAGPLFALYGGIVLAVRVLGAKATDRISVVTAATGSLVFLGLGLLVIAVFTEPAGIYTGVVFIALGLALNFPVLMRHVVDAVPDRERTHAVASFSIFFDVSFAVGAAFTGAIVTIADERWGFAIAGVVVLSGVGLATRLRTPSRHADAVVFAVETPVTTERP